MTEQAGDRGRRQGTGGEGGGQREQAGDRGRRWGTEEAGRDEEGQSEGREEPRRAGQRSVPDSGRSATWPSGPPIPVATTNFSGSEGLGRRRLHK